MVGRGGMDNRGSVNNWGMISWGRGMVSRSGMDNGGSVDNRGMISWSRGMISRGSMDNRGMYSSMGLVDRVAHSRGIALLDTLVVGLVCGNYGQKCGTDKSLHVCSSIGYDQMIPM